MLVAPAAYDHPVRRLVLASILALAGLAAGCTAHRGSHANDGATSGVHASVTSADGWSGLSGLDPNHTAPALPVITRADFPQVGSVKWALNAENDQQHKIEITVDIGNSCATFHGITVAENASAVTIGAYVVDVARPDKPGGSSTGTRCNELDQLRTGTVTLSRPLGARSLVHAATDEP